MSFGIVLNQQAQGPNPAAGKGSLLYDTDISPAGLAWVDSTGLVTRLSGLGRGDVFSVIDAGAVGDGVADDITIIQSVVDAVDTRGKGGVVLLPPGYRFYISTELQIRADHCTVIAYGATIIAPVGGTTGTYAGDMAVIVDRRTASRIIVDSHIVGGTWQPQNAADNAVGIVAGRQCTIRDLEVVMPAGIASAAVIAENAPTSTINECASIGVRAKGGGGQGVLVFGTGANAITGFTVTDCVCDDAQIGLFVSGDTDAHPIVGLNVSNFTADNTVQFGASFVRCKDGAATGLVLTNCGGLALRVYQPANFSVNVVNARSIAVPVAPAGYPLSAVFTQDGSASDQHWLRGLSIYGAWTNGIEPRAQDGVYDNIHLNGCTNGIANSTGARTVWGTITYEGVTTPITTLPSATDVWGKMVLLGATATGPVMAHTFFGWLYSNGLQQATVTKTAGYTLTDADFCVLVNVAGGATMTLPTAVGRLGRIFVLKRIDFTPSSSNNFINVTPAGAETIDDVTPWVLRSPGQWVAIQSDDSNWKIIGSGIAPSTATATNLTLTRNHRNVFVDASSGPVNITIPAGSAHQGIDFWVKKTDSSANAVTLVRSAADTFDGATSIVLASQYETAGIVSRGTADWAIIAGRAATQAVNDNSTRIASTAYVDRAANHLYAPGSVTVATGNFWIQCKRLQLTGTQRLSVAGTGRYRGMN